MAWAINDKSSARSELVWPRAYTARFNPQLEVLDETGRVVAHEGDLIIGSCVSKDEGAWLIEAGDVRPPTWRPGDG